MKDDSDMDQALRARFAAMRAHDARSTPAFRNMLHAAPDGPISVVSPAMAAGRAHAPAVRWTRTRVVAWSTPFLAAAALAVFLLQPSRAAEREFEQLVADWSRTSAATQHAPTDGLLAVPGSEFLRRVPSFGDGVGAPRARRPS